MNGTITVLFLNGREVVYTKKILMLLMTDTAVLEIMDNETGEMLYIKGE